MKCWTYIDGKPREFKTMAILAVQIDIDYEEFSAARKAAGAEKIGDGFEVGGHSVVLGAMSEAAAESGRVEKARLVGMPLLFGLCTHRLGAYRGGEW